MDHTKLPVTSIEQILVTHNVIFNITCDLITFK